MIIDYSTTLVNDFTFYSHLKLGVRGEDRMDQEKAYQTSIANQRIYDLKVAERLILDNVKMTLIELGSIRNQQIWEAKAYNLPI